MQFDEHAGIARAMRDINAAYRANPPLWQRDDDPGGFEWIDANDAASNVFSWIRWDDQGRPVVSLSNMSALPRDNYRLGLPVSGQWEEILNTDAREYGGSGMGNLGAVAAADEPWHGRAASARVTLPPLATIWLRPDPSAATVLEER